MRYYGRLAAAAVGASSLCAGALGFAHDGGGGAASPVRPVHAAHRVTGGDGVLLSRKIDSPWDRSGLALRLYQYQTCPFCSKVRAFLDYHGFTYEVVEVNPVTRRQLKFSEYKKVPILVAQGLDDKQLNDSVFIVSLLKTLLLQADVDFDRLLSYYPHHKTKNAKGTETLECQNKYFVMFNEQIQDKMGIENKKREREWRQWVDQVFIHTISPNVYRTPSEAVATFKWFSTVGDWDVNFPAWERLLAVYVGAAAMYLIAKRLKNKHQLGADVRRAMYNAGETWTDALGDQSFMGGDAPDLADLALYGAMTSFEGCATMGELRAAVPAMGLWFDRMKEQVARHAGATLMHPVAPPHYPS